MSEISSVEYQMLNPQKTSLFQAQSRNRRTLFQTVSTNRLLTYLAKHHSFAYDSAVSILEKEGMQGLIDKALHCASQPMSPLKLSLYALVVLKKVKASKPGSITRQDRIIICSHLSNLDKLFHKLGKTKDNKVVQSIFD